jgi:hypothetical protein
MSSSITHTQDRDWATKFENILKAGQDDPQKQLMSLRAVTAVSGVIHEAQLLQLRMWGAIAFGYTKWEAEVSVETKTVTYKLTKKKYPKELAAFVASLDRSVHWLFGDDWSLSVREGAKKLYEGQRKATVNDERTNRAKQSK